ncbi:hypothetical protein HUJ05_009503 [Dendroctonus ponderosae]|nr:hypothetical protein HUJ05_009498 [Dendroctonus ponderosae]KAH1002131.1 hypothetical protein HUJ05_009503 [Dendroctonus ponderosae]
MGFCGTAQINGKYRRLLSPYQPYRNRSFVLTTCGSGRLRISEKLNEQYRRVVRFLFLERKSRSEVKEPLAAVYGATKGFMNTKPACNVKATPPRSKSFFEAGVKAITLAGIDKDCLRSIEQGLSSCESNSTKYHPYVLGKIIENNF